MAPGLADSWGESANGLAYELKLRKGVTFHHGDPFMAIEFSLTHIHALYTIARTFSRCAAHVQLEEREHMREYHS
jgi:MarR-like DNA-binding transcriptional regulator SgrR of sgrS sRNA